MRLKRFVATDMGEAMQLIRGELGPEAVMVHSRELRPRGIARLWRRPCLEVLAAVEEDRPARAPMHLPTAAQVDEAARLQRLEKRLDGLCRSVEVLVERPVPPAERATDRRLTRPSPASDAVCEMDPLGVTESAEETVSRLRKRLPRFSQLTLRGDSPDVFVFLGPTGVGKTTTIAKIASEFVSRRGYRVALVSADTFRVAAIPQIEIYADLIGVPLRVAYEPDDLKQAVEELQGYDAVLVDMPGRSPADRPGLQELDAFLQAVPRSRRLLLLQAGGHLADLRRSAKAFGGDKCDGVILTKLDETEVLGPVASVLAELARPVHYLTTGQNVPQDIEPATADRLISMLLRDARSSGEGEGAFVRTGLLDLARCGAQSGA